VFFKKKRPLFYVTRQTRLNASFSSRYPVNLFSFLPLSFLYRSVLCLICEGTPPSFLSRFELFFSNLCDALGTGLASWPESGCSFVFLIFWMRRPDPRLLFRWLTLLLGLLTFFSDGRSGVFFSCSTTSRGCPAPSAATGRSEQVFSLQNRVIFDAPDCVLPPLRYAMQGGDPSGPGL